MQGKMNLRKRYNRANGKQSFSKTSRQGTRPRLVRPRVMGMLHSAVKAPLVSEQATKAMT